LRITHKIVIINNNPVAFYVAVFNLGSLGIVCFSDQQIDYLIAQLRLSQFYRERITGVYKFQRTVRLHTMLVNSAFDMLASGRHPMYTGIFNPLSCSANLINVCKISMAYDVRTGMRTGSQKRTA